MGLSKDSKSNIGMVLIIKTKQNTLLLILFLVLPFLLVAQDITYSNLKDDIYIYKKDIIIPYYKDGDFHGLKDEIEKLKNEAKNIHEIIYFTIWEIKVEYCLGNIRNALKIKDDIEDTQLNSLLELTDSYKKYLLHEPTLENLLNCREYDNCLCQIGGFDPDLVNLDFLDYLDYDFSNIYLFFQRRTEQNFEIMNDEKTIFNDLYYPIEYQSTIRKNNNIVEAKLYILNNLSKKPNYYDYEDKFEFEQNTSKFNRLNTLQKNIPLEFTHKYTNRNYTTDKLQYIPTRDLNNRPIKGFILINDYRYYFEFNEDEPYFDNEESNSINEKIVPILWVDGWKIIPKVEKDKIRLLVHEDYVDAINIYIRGNEEKNMNDYINLNDKNIFVIEKFESLSINKWPKLVEENVFQTKEIEITISDDEGEALNDLNVVLTNKYPGYEKEQRRKIVSMILIGVGIALNIIIPFL